MTLIRKVFWPAAIALGLLVFLGAIGNTGIIDTASAFHRDNDDDGDYCKILGPSTILVGGSYLYVGVLNNTTGEDDHIVSIDNIIGNSKITSAVIADNDRYGNGNTQNSHGWNRAVYDTSVGPSNLVVEIPDYNALELSKHVVDDLYDSFNPDGTPGKGFNVFTNLNVCGASSLAALTRIYQDAILAGEVCTFPSSSGPITQTCSPLGGSTFGNDIELYGDFDIDCPSGATCTIAAAVITAAVNAVLAGIIADDDCDDIATDAGKAAVGAGASELVGLQFYDFTFDLCENGWDDGEDDFLDSFVIVDVTCSVAGNFDITFTEDDDAGDTLSMNVRCLGVPSGRSTVTATPSIEIVPAPGNVSNSFVNVLLLDADGNQAGPADVDFLTDRCSVESSSVDTVAEWTVISGLFAALNPNVPSTAAAIQASPAGTTQPDSTRAQDSMVAINLGTSTRAGTILMCDPQAAPGATPGVATITVIIDSSSAGISAGTVNDVVLSVKVTVVGPPATIVVAASPTSVRCGEKATITATVKDAIGQNVSEHTRVEAVTNAGGVLAGTGAVANQAGLVSPISSTVSETFSGVSTFFLLTSEQHSGPYEVVVTSGGTGALGSALGGVFSTAPVSAQATVTCSIPAAPVAPVAVVPTVTAPRVGTGGITPPNTGDAGLAASNGTSWASYAAFGAMGVFALAGIVALKRRNIGE